MEYKIIVVGIGPGSADYLLPIAKRTIEKATVLVGSKRALETFASKNAKTCVIDKNILGVMQFIHRELIYSEVVVMVSGDPGFYSLLPALKRQFPQNSIKVIPGISSIQLASARLAETWQDVKLISMHGRDINIEELRYESGKKLAVLTDHNNSPAAIAKLLLSLQWPATSSACILSNLSYESESCITQSLYEICKLEGYQQSVMVVGR